VQLENDREQYDFFVFDSFFYLIEKNKFWLKIANNANMQNAKGEFV
jgi:hypothetical protein